MRSGLLLSLFIRPIAGFHVYYDGGHSFGSWHEPGTAELCGLRCPIGYGCAIQGYNISTCTRCAPLSVSAEGSTWCKSCKYADASSWGYWSSYIKQFLEPSEDQGHCEVMDKADFWHKRLRNGALTFLTCLPLALLLLAYRLCVAEHRLHRLVRKKQWADAEEMLKSESDAARKVLYCVSQSTEKLVNRWGRDGRTPLQLALELGATENFDLVAGANAIGKSTDAAVLPSRHPSQQIHGVDDKAEETDWRTLVNAMLDPSEDVDDESESTDDERDEAPLRCSFFCTAKKVKVACTVWLACLFSNGFMWWSLHEGSTLGALLDQGNFEGISKSVPPETLQECDRWCTVFSCIYAANVLLVTVALGSAASFYVDWVATLLRLVKKTANVSAAVALLGYVFTNEIIKLVTIIEGSFIDYGGMAACGGGWVFGTVFMLSFGPWFVERSIMRNADPYAIVLESLVSQKKHPASTLWPLVRRCMVSTGATVWQIVIPKHVDSIGVKSAVEVIVELTENARTIQDTALVLSTLIEAHIAGIVNTAACTKCIAEVTSRAPEARLYRGNAKSTPAEMAMLSSKSTEIKRAALLLLFDRFAIVSIDEHIYESATCRVYRAEDLQPGGKTLGKVVALKLFAAPGPYAKEVKMRDSLNFHSDAEIADFVVADIERYDHRDASEDCKRVRPEWKQEIITALFENFGSGAIVMPLADYDLNNRLSLTRIAGIDANACVSILRPIATALAKLHERNVVHADVKPRNVVLVDNTWKLIDLDAATKSGNIIDTSAPGFKWTSGFASPEIARCRTALRSTSDDGRLSWALAADPKMDVFSFGILAFELLTGQTLFSQDTCNNSMTDSECVLANV